MVSTLGQFTLTDKVAIITGGGKGIGAAAAVSFADAGADVVLSARTREDLDAVAMEVQARGRQAVVVPGDVNDFDYLADLVRRAVSHFGRLDIVVNNAGAILPGAIETDALARRLVNMDPSVRAAMIANTPMRRNGVPEDISAAAVYLCSPAASWVTGKLLEVDGNAGERLIPREVPDL